MVFRVQTACCSLLFASCDAISWRHDQHQVKRESQQLISPYGFHHDYSRMAVTLMTVRSEILNWFHSAFTFHSQLVSHDSQESRNSLYRTDIQKQNTDYSYRRLYCLYYTLYYNCSKYLFYDCSTIQPILTRCEKTHRDFFTVSVFLDHSPYHYLTIDIYMVHDHNPVAESELQNNLGILG